MKIAQIKAEKKVKEYLDAKARTSTGAVVTRREFFAPIVIGKSKHVEKYASKKINGCYEELKNPKVSYYLETLEDIHGKAEQISYKVPKVVYDAYMTVEI